MEEGQYISAAEAKALLDTMVKRPLRWAIKSPDVELFDLGFGGEGETLPPYVIHAICTVKVVPHKKRLVQLYQGTADSGKFREEMEELLGLPVLRTSLSDKHDLWLDLGDYWVIFVTFEDGEESW